MLIALALAIVVGGGHETHIVGPHERITDVAAAVHTAAPGDTVVVRAGTYRVANLRIERPITLLGDSGAVLDGGGSAIMVVTADHVTIRGFTLRNVGASATEDRAGIRLDAASDCAIVGNEFADTFFAIYAARTSHCRIASNRIIGPASSSFASGNGIHLYASRALTITDNTIRGHRDGIYLEFTRQAHIAGNWSEANSRYGLHFMFSDSCSYARNSFVANGAGVAVMYSNFVVMEGNEFRDATGPAAYGLLLKDIRDAELTRNRFSGNARALSVEGSERVLVSQNTLAGNGVALRLFGSTGATSFTDNSFAGNAFDVVTDAMEVAIRFDGNHWDRYQGFDLDGDGRGDVPFRPVRLFSRVVQRYPAAALLMHSLLASLLDAAEEALPVLTSASLADPAPALGRAP